jgi:type IV secretion system protein VirB2
MNVIAAALNWIQAVMLGTVATSVAVIAVASVGFLMFTGRIDYRRAVQVIMGCFILFGASTISSGIQGFVAGNSVPIAASQPSPPPPVTAPPANPNGLDPYAGAGVPQY